MRLEDYMKELQSVKLLEPKEEAALWQAYKVHGDRTARRRIIESYQPLVFKQAMPYRALPGIMDVIQEGTVGLIEAVEHYDPARGVAFSLFAVHRIRGRMADFLRKEGASDIACMDARPETGGETMKESLADTVALSVPEAAESHELAGRLHAASTSKASPSRRWPMRSTSRHRTSTACKRAASVACVACCLDSYSTGEKGKFAFSVLSSKKKNSVFDIISFDNRQKTAIFAVFSRI